MSNFCKAVALLPVLVILTGCPTPPKPAAKITPIVIPRPDSVPIELNTVPTTNQAPQTVPAPIIPSPTIPSENLQPPPIVRQLRADEWVPWGDWGDRFGFGKSRQVKNNPHLTYEVRNPANIVSIAIGSRIALWNGLHVGLGFGPRQTNGQSLVHSLDIAKTLIPLATIAPLPQKAQRVVVIDPGHGGDNLGAKCAVNNHSEKDYTLDWALRVQPLLVASGWKVFLTRTADVDLSLTNRVAFAEKVRADLFVSLHFNSSEHGSGRQDQGGLETYCLTPTGMPSNLTRDFDDVPSLVFPNNAFDTENIQYAFRLHRSLLQFTGRKDRGIRRARFMTVLQGQKRAAVLLEGGYMTNPEEARLIATAGYRQRLAQAVAAALSE